MNEPVSYQSRFLVWTDHEAYAHALARLPLWFWQASGPRGHMSGCENSSDEAQQRAYAAYSLLSETKPGKAA